MTEKIPIRQTKAVGQFAVGAVIQVADYSLTPCDIRQWKDNQGRWFGESIPFTVRLKSAIEAVAGSEKEIRKPPVIREDHHHQTRGDLIPAVRFPAWMYCPRCGLLHRTPWIGAEDKKYPRCRSEKCFRPRLIPVRWVMISPLGCMSDLPWAYLAHRNTKKPEQRNCRLDTELYIITNKNDYRRYLYCDKCKVRESLDGVLDENFLSKIHQMPNQPWDVTFVNLRSPDESESQATDSKAFAVELTDSRIHIPEIRTALIIPPESRIDPRDLRARLSQHQDYDLLMAARDHPAKIRRRLNYLAGTVGCSLDDLQKAFNDLVDGWPLGKRELSAGASTDDLYQAEYNAFLTPYPDLKDWETFITHSATREWRRYFAGRRLSPLAHGLGLSVDQLVAADRLREVQALLGFYRGSRDGVLVPPDLTGEAPWVPGCELFGEGFFFTLNENMLNEWEHDPLVRRRSADLAGRLENTVTGTDFPKPAPRFILLHTLAHLIIRELEFDCGYSAASLKERIYCHEPTAENPNSMAGILIYVAVPDKAGSLGGITIQAEPDQFIRLLLRAVEKARWCSLDPVCRENDGQGPGQLNRAACHACCLLPETSCAYTNRLLDRLFLLGDPEKSFPGFLEYATRAGERVCEEQSS